jgi:hypothetical protein
MFTESKEPKIEAKACCQDNDNLEVVERRAVQGSAPADLVVRKCKVCGCRHFELTIDPGKLGLTMSGVG